MKKLLVASIAAAAFCSAPALAADMAVKAPPPPVLPPTPVYSWTGFYIGADVGGMWTNSNANWLLPTTTVPSGTNISAGTDASSFIGSLHAGYNWQFAPAAVAGVEGDWSLTHAGGSWSQPPNATFSGPETMSSTLDWLASIRGRLGVLVAPNLLAYATGGAAWGKLDYAAAVTCYPGCVPPYSVSSAFSNTADGYVVGGGFEWAMTMNWYIRAEYLFYHLDSSQSVVATTPVYPHPSVFNWSNTDISLGRVGVSYKF
jgi:outer membrane immunogenic protein